MSTPSARRLVMDILRRTLDNNQDLQAAVDDVLSASSATPQDKGLATELAYGYLRMRGRIDFLLSQLLKNPVQTSPIMKRILGVAIYELLFLSRIPDYATLDWAVTLVRERLDQTMGKVANGVLRSLLRLGLAVRFEDYYQTKTAGHDQFLSAWYSCPKWLVRMWLNSYGKERTQAFLQATLGAPPLGVRINRGHARAEELRNNLQPLKLDSSNWGFAVTQWPEFLQQAVSEGAATRQSLAAQKIMDFLGVDHWPSPVLDACAGRGGKTYLVAERGKSVWASDVNVFRLRQLKAEGARLGFDIPAFRAQGQGPYPLLQMPRTVFLDVPCSGLGVISRRPDIKWKRTAADCAGLVALQGEILRAAADILTSGGCLAYVTCTLNPEENEKQIERFTRDHPSFSCLRQSTSDPSEGLGEFFYGAVLRKS
ncbi:16S rRNA (cytosine967-C5)-methyltransferase [Desulfomicrobium norvegicum]|uniref:16S rRNA (Cytosine967-C5)-methyltransferase n=1 Tax=Desulfomicrobium norvegicum (strain DSM 1741 / NCIMB 8310) TaxID=52561 RepID=A0A8G2C1N2_DESNO|nr:transcription antitermination factor NusB [Desulfomicrobium norvegicum]SFL52989.1 16S rRNA (cytosine967-C5)-methyltransferase [Desulfomicrobium norvegicum]